MPTRKFNVTADSSDFSLSQVPTFDSFQNLSSKSLNLEKDSMQEAQESSIIDDLDSQQNSPLLSCRSNQQQSITNFISRNKNQKKSQFYQDDLAVQDEFSQKYSIIKTLGKGKFGRVYLVQKKDTQNSQEFAAAKQIQFDFEEQEVIKEWNIIKSLDHPLIIKAKDMIVNKDKKEISLIMDYFEGQSLYQLIKQQLITEDMSVLIMKQLLEVLAYLHSKNILHRDISLENILFSKESMEIRLIDFGISTTIFKQTAQEDEFNFSPTINDKYKPPEYSSFSYQITDKVDMYAAGLVFLSMIFKRPIYAKQNFQKYYNKINNSLILEVLKNLLNKDFKLRIEAKNAIQLKLFQI